MKKLFQSTTSSFLTPRYLTAVGLTELNYGSNSGVLVVVGAGDEDDLDSCKTTPASAQVTTN
jgi:hypothetical protein